jgi:hypothetical protein
VSTLISTLVTQSRRHLVEATADYWTDQELADLANKGIKDLWRKINDLFQDYFVTIDETNVTLAANSSVLSGIPASVYRVVTIEPRVLGQNNPNPGLIFKGRDFNHPDFVRARAMTPMEPKNTVLFYRVMNAGAPVGAPSIYIAPQVTSAVNLRLVYNQVLADAALSDANPIPGESDNAIIAWTVAYARAKERDDRAPDPEWIAIYGTEKNNLVAQMTPRTIQEPEVVEGMFEDMWPDWQ